MFNERISLKGALNRVNEKIITKINDGFMRQLEIFEELDYDLSKKSLFKSKMLEFIAEKIQNGENVKDIYIHKQKSNEYQKDTSAFKCKKCRSLLFTSESQLKHSKPGEESRSIRAICKRGLIESGECTKDIYIEPVNWLLDRIQELDGKIMCPKCNSKIGSYSWCGHSCSCGTWIVPAFQISESRVDYCRAILK
jgi:dual specificity phosphatase 12